jgi:hypothetical protein
MHIPHFSRRKLKKLKNKYNRYSFWGHLLPVFGKREQVYLSYRIKDMKKLNNFILEEFENTTNPKLQVISAMMSMFPEAKKIMTAMMGFGF